jgi:hypothetical protein
VGAPAWALGVPGKLDATAGPEQRGPRVGSGQLSGYLREDPGQDAAAHVAGWIKAEAEALGDVVTVQQGLVAPIPAKPSGSAIPAGW